MKDAFKLLHWMSHNSSLWIQMILTTCGHRRIPTLWRLLERNLSKKSPPAADSQVNVLSQNTLPTPKMRALISLYHQADSWVTPENLLQKIDEAFVPSDNTDSLALSASRAESTVSVTVMKNRISLMRSAPKMAQWDSSSSVREDQYPASDWSESGRNRRDLKVIEALYGVAFNHGSTSISQAFLPGLEVLQESASSAIQDHKDDRDAEDLQQDLVTVTEVCLIILCLSSRYHLYHILIKFCTVLNTCMPMDEILQMHSTWCSRD